MLSALPARWLALAFLLLALALVFGNPILLAGSVFVLLIVLLGTLLTPPGGIEVEREMTRLVCWAGDRLEVRRRVHVRSGLGTLYVHDELPAEMEVVEGNNFRAVWKWPGPKIYDLSYEFLCPKRGLYELGETLRDTEGALGLQRRKPRHCGRNAGVFGGAPHSGGASGQGGPCEGAHPLFQDGRGYAGSLHNRFQGPEALLPRRPYADS